MTFRFRDCAVDAARFELRRGGNRVPVQPTVLRLLLFLLTHRDRTVTKDELLEAVWPGVAVGEGSLTRAVSLARTALGESQRDAEVIRTVRGRGYRIGVPVVETGPGEDVDAADPRAGLVCRERELAVAREALDRALAGRGQVLLLAGEPGIGKTRLAEAVATLARARGAGVVWGRCPEGAGAPAFWPWLQVLRGTLAEWGTGALAAHPGEHAAELAELLPELRHELPGLPAPDRSDLRHARFRLFDAVVALLRAAAAARPVVVILDDLQSADEPSLALLRFLAPELGETPALLVATYRDSELRPGAALEGTLAELARAQPPARTLLLRGLTQGCVGRLALQLLGREPPEALVEALHRRTEGNPLFLVEVLQWLAGREELLAERSAWEAIPEGVRQAIGRRVDALPAACRQVLAAAAVVGREFALPVLASVCERSEDALLEPLEQAERARLVEPVQDHPGRLRFSHALVADTLRERLGTAARVRLHRRSAEVLEQLYTPRALAPSDRPGRIPGTHLAELAHHFGEAALAGDVEKAVDYARRAGDHASGALAFAEAARLYERALRLLELAGERDEARRLGLLLALAEAQVRAGEAAASAAALEQALESARASGDREALAEAAVRRHQQAVGGNAFVADVVRVSLLEEALAGLATGDGALRARLLAALASELLLRGEGARSQALSREALAIARRLGQPDALWSVLRAQRMGLLEPQREAEREALAESVFALARETGDREREFAARFEFRLPLAVEAADAVGVDREIAACEALAEALRQPFFRWSTRRAQAARALWQGRLEEAEALLLEARSLGRRCGELGDLSYHSGLLSLRRMQGRFGALERALQADHVLPKDRGHKAAALALWLAEAGRADEARAELARLGPSRFAAVRRDSNFTYNLALLAETAALVASEPDRAGLYEILAPWAGRYLAIPGVVAAGCASRFLGLLAASLRRFDEAEPHFEEALRVERRMGARPFEAWTQRDWARMLATRGAPGDRAAASERRARAAEIAREIGLAGCDAG